MRSLKGHVSLEGLPDDDVMILLGRCKNDRLVLKIVCQDNQFRFLPLEKEPRTAEHFVVIMVPRRTPQRKVKSHTIAVVQIDCLTELEILTSL